MSAKIEAEGRINLKIPFHQYIKLEIDDKTVIRPYLHNSMNTK